MARKVKCPECGTFNDKENAIYHNSKYYCKICYDNKMRESQDYKDLIAYICELYEIDAPTGWMLKQIKDFKEQFHYTYRGMKTTLNFFYEIQEGHDTADSMGIGIIPFVYDDAKKFYVDKKAVKDSVTELSLENIASNKRIIKVKRGNESENLYKDMAFIDIDKL